MLKYIVKALIAPNGLVQLICRKGELADVMLQLSKLPVNITDPLTSLTDYQRTLEVMTTEENVSLVIPHFLQKGYGYTHEASVDDPTSAMHSVRVISDVIKKLSDICYINSNKLISVDVVPDDYIFDSSTVYNAVDGLAAIIPFCTSHLAFIEGEDSIVLRDKAMGPSTVYDDSQALEALKEMCLAKQVNVILPSAERIVELTSIGDVDVDVRLHRSGQDSAVRVKVLKERKPSFNDTDFIPIEENGYIVTKEMVGLEEPKVKTGPYKSPRGMMLLDQTPSDKPILTGENYEKWYDLYLLHPDGTVEPVTKNYDIDDCNYETGCVWIDHNYHPEIFNKMAGKHGWYIGQVAIEVAAGRWALEYHKQFDSAQYFANEQEEC